MGLDMYLSAKRFFWTDEQSKDIRSKKKGSVAFKIKSLFPEMKEDELDYVIFQVGYWRKANAIHQWFVENVQKGKDDCGTYDVSKEQLTELKKLCEQVIEKTKLKEGMIQNGATFKDGKEVPCMEKGKYIENPKIAKELLPTTSGFFFGSTDYDEWYIDDLKNTVKIIDHCLKLSKDWDIEYHSSW